MPVRQLAQPVNEELYEPVSDERKDEEHQKFREITVRKVGDLSTPAPVGDIDVLYIQNSLMDQCREENDGWISLCMDL